MKRTAEEFVHQLPIADNPKGKRWFVGDFQGSGDGTKEGAVYMLTDGRITTTWHIQRGITSLYSTKSSAKRAAQRWLEKTLDESAGEPDEPIPPCAAAMGCLCAGHARGNPADVACDTREGAR